MYWYGVLLYQQVGDEIVYEVYCVVCYCGFDVFDWFVLLMQFDDVIWLLINLYCVYCSGVFQLCEIVMIEVFVLLIVQVVKYYYVLVGVVQIGIL